MASLLIEADCADHGMERYKVKIIRKYNIKHEEIIPRFRTRPRHELSGIFIGRNISYETAKEYLEHYLNQSKDFQSIISIKLLR